MPAFVLLHDLTVVMWVHSNKTCNNFPHPATSRPLRAQSKRRASRITVPTFDKITKFRLFWEENSDKFAKERAYSTTWLF